MSESHEIEDVALANEESLQTLVRAISLSQGEFSLILVRCNYGDLRERILSRLRELSVNVDGDTPLQIRELVLDKSVKTLYTTIQKALVNEQPNALFIFGLESVNALDRLIVASNQVREEFRKNFPFPIVLWLNDEVLQKFIRLAPDFDSWTTTIEFTIATAQLIENLNKSADVAFTRILNAGAGKFLDNAVLNIALFSNLRAELNLALKDLQSRGKALDPELEANLQFLQGREAQANDEMANARQYYEQSLAFWQQTNRIDRHGCLLFYLGLWWRRYAVLKRLEYQSACRQAKTYFQQCIQVFQEGNCPDLAAKFINPLGEVLTRLKEWDELEKVAQNSVNLHEAYQNSNPLAYSGYAYGLLAEVALSRSQWKEAKKYAELAIEKNNQPDLVTHVLNPANQDWSWSWKQYQSLYLLLLAKSQTELKQVEEALKNLETAKEESNPQYDPQLYIDILDKLRLLYFQQGKYREAFNLKLEQRAIQAEYGFRPFIGAGSLRPIKQVINPAFESANPKVRAQQRLTASGHLQDVNHLLKRISRNDYKLIVIHGLSGVGKSSLVWAGLEPSLNQQAIGDRDALPVVLRFYKKYYTDWVKDLGEKLTKALNELGIYPSLDPPQPPELRREQEKQEQFPSPSLDPPQPPLVRGEQEGKSPLTNEKQEQFPSPPCEGGLGGSLDSPEAIIEQLKINAERNLLTVLIFDQFEEFFFICTDLLERRKFYQFLQISLNLPFVKVVMSLREDYLHYLLECDRFTDLDVINNNILDKSIRYCLRDFSPERAKSVILELTERSQFYLEPALIDEIVKDLAGELGEIRPIELQVVGAQLQTDNITTLEKYRQPGNNPKEKLVQRSLEEVVKDCGKENERAAQLVLYFLTNETGTRPPKTRDELVTDFETVDLSAEVGKLELVLYVLVASGLVFQIPDSPADRYQLVHDYLVSFIRQSEQAREVDKRKHEIQQRQVIEAKLNRDLKRQTKLNQFLNRQLQFAVIGMFFLLGPSISAVWFGIVAMSRKQGKLEAKLEIVPVLRELGLSIEQIAERLKLDVEIIRQRVQDQ